MVDEKLILKYALQNALLFGGRANPGAVMGKVLAEKPELKSEAKALGQLVAKAVKEVNALSPEEQKKRLEGMAPELLEKKVHEKQEHVLPELPNVNGPVVMRMAPYPSGPLHIGNARMAVLNDEYAKKYGGKLILAFDDTIGVEKSVIMTNEGEKELQKKEILPEAYDLIRDGLNWLGVKWHDEVYKSDRLDIFYKYAKQLIEMGHAYVCTCAPDVFRIDFKSKKADCPCRDIPVSESLERWRDMLDGKYSAGGAVVRLKTGMDMPDPALRDPVAMRITDREHPKVGRKYRVWPLLEFSWAIDDRELGITHILRGKDLVKEDRIEEIVWGFFGWPKAEFIHYGKFHISGTEGPHVDGTSRAGEAGTISKSKAKQLIAEGKYFGWDDPRTWSLQSLKRRGFSPQVIRKFLLSFGLSLADVSSSPEILYSMSKDEIDAGANRYFFVNEPQEFEIIGAPMPSVAKVPVHPDFADRGFREFRFERAPLRVLISKSDISILEKNEAVRLKDLFNVSLSGKALEYSAEQGGVYDVPKIHWLPAESGVNAEVVMPDGSKAIGVAEKGTSILKAGDIVQFERFGFVRRDFPGVFWFLHR